MVAVLVHHADALSPAVDPQRPLSERGLRQAARLADQARAAGCAPAVIWHSGKLRARQTAEAFLRACNPLAEFRMVRGLRPEDPPEWMRDELNVESRDVMLVGHMPHIAALARRLSPDAGEFPLNGVVAFRRSGDKVWTEVWRLVAPSD
jgi:phosphohistidine phosphatase